MNDIYTITNFSPETEARTIGALIAIGSRKSLKTQKAMLRLVPECFYKSELAEIFQAIQAPTRICWKVGLVQTSSR